ncbi:MAG: DUF4390 domain-containing protein [Methylophilaceae bacterium]
MSVFAASSSIVIKSAELYAANEVYKLSADLDISFDEDIEEAINKGVPLNFLLEFQVVSPRKYWFDDEITTLATNFTLSYHALSRQYLVSRNGHQTSYETLSEAKLELMEIEDWKVLEKSLIEKGEVYKAALLMRLDQSKLPQALQVEAIGSKDWNLTSQKFEWEPKELNKPKELSK